MKKILFMSCAVAALMFASCASDEDVKMPQGNAISFANAFVNNSTRGTDITTDGITDFGVYGYMDEVAGTIFSNEKVTKNDTWGYKNTQYWVANHNYWFAAIAPFGAAEFTAPASLLATGEFGTIKYDNSKQLDLLYANQNNIAGKASGNEKVAFTFNHLLAKSMFTFKNEATNSNVKFVVSKVTITDGVKNATITLGDNAAWAAVEGDTGMALNYEINATDIVQGATNATEPMYMVPIAKEYTVTFLVDVYNGTVKVNGETPISKTVKIPATVLLKRGNSYNFTCALKFENIVENTEPIEFVVTSVIGWENFTDNVIL